MGMLKGSLTFPQPLTPSHIADLRLAASTLTGWKRRAFEAAMALKYCEGTPLQAGTTLGWSRRTVALGLAERRTGIRCLGAQSACSGRKRWEDTQPEAADALCQLADAHALLLAVADPASEAACGGKEYATVRHAAALDWCKDPDRG